MKKPTKLDCRKKETRDKDGRHLNTTYALGYNDALEDFQKWLDSEESSVKNLIDHQMNQSLKQWGKLSIRKDR